MGERNPVLTLIAADNESLDLERNESDLTLFISSCSSLEGDFQSILRNIEFYHIFCFNLFSEKSFYTTFSQFEKCSFVTEYIHKSFPTGSNS